MNKLRQKLWLYLVTDSNLCKNYGLVNTVKQAVAGGVTMVQLRAKQEDTHERIQMAIAIKAALAGTEVPLVINDDLDAAIATDVDGAHIGQTDMPAARARALLGRDKILGLSCETPSAVSRADPDVVDYLGLGPVFATATKADHQKPIGFDGLADLLAKTTLPTVAIGGLKADHQKQIMARGADGLAVVSAICGHPNPKVAARKFINLKERA